MDHTYGGAQVVRVIDGDTIVLDIDLGFGVWLREQHFRLFGCNAREHDQDGGPEAIVNLQELLPVGALVSLTSVKADKFGGRFDAVIVMADGRNLTQLLIEQGWAAAWDGLGRKPVPAWPRIVAS